MLDFFDIPGSTKADVQRFTANSTAASVGWHTWRKPRGISIVNILLLAGGGGGGGGFLQTVGTGAGGGAGGSSGQTILNFPAWALPDILYISVGYGGAGGAGSGLTGSAGIASYVSIDPSITANNLLALANGGTGGSAGASTAAGGTAAGGAAVTIANAPLSALANSFSITVTVGVGNINLGLLGQTGPVGGYNTAGLAGTSLTIPTTGLIVTAGAGGASIGGTGFAGGNITGAGIFPTSNGGAAGGTTTAPGGNGAGGFSPIKGLLYFYGGTGGGSSGSAGGVGGAGGNAATGSGGGGGGAGFSAGGAGGRGGDGIAILTAW